uniref:CYRIA/CYRIB Rac1 binding domain-containing protein n=3 Tax=Neoaves TaxID=3078114 RepID=A0A8C8APU4_9STRI
VLVPVAHRIAPIPDVLPPPLPSGGLPGEGGPWPPGQTHGRGLSLCTSSSGQFEARWGQPGAGGCSGTPVSRTAVAGQPGLTPTCPPPPRLGSSLGKETDQGEKPRQEGPRAGGRAVGRGAGTPPWLSPPRAPLRALRVSLPGALPCRCAADGGRDGGVEPGERRAGGGTGRPGRAAVIHGRRAGDPRGGCSPGARCPPTHHGLGRRLVLSPSQAIQNPGDLRLQERAWSAVCPLVAKLKRFYEFSLRLENALRSLLEALTSPPYAPTQHLEREQALAKQFAEILHFTLSFDELKMTNPAIQNDFSYYRRTISRNRINNLQLDAESEVNNEMANRMSLFYAEATPMLKTLSNATTKFVSENKTLPIEDTTDCLSTMACVCRVMLETPEYRSRFTNTETLLFCMRVMVGVIILYDHVHPVGAFAKTSKIDMKGCIKVLKDQPSTSTEGLLNALRYTTRHLNDDTTSKQIRALLQ